MKNHKLNKLNKYELRVVNMVLAEAVNAMQDLNRDAEGGGRFALVLTEEQKIFLASAVLKLVCDEVGR